MSCGPCSERSIPTKERITSRTVDAEIEIPLLGVLVGPYQARVSCCRDAGLDAPVSEERMDTHTLLFTPNPPKDTDGRREDSGRGVRELQGRWPGLHWGRWEVGGRSSVAAQGPYGRLRELRCAGWRENTQQGTLADRGGASLRGRWVSCSLAVRPGVEWLAAGPRRE